jgi:hypothetical protein
LILYKENAQFRSGCLFAARVRGSGCPRFGRHGSRSGAWRPVTWEDYCQPDATLAGDDELAMDLLNEAVDQRQAQPNWLAGLRRQADAIIG